MAANKTIIAYSLIEFLLGLNIINVPNSPKIRKIILLRFILSLRKITAIMLAHMGMVNSMENTVLSGNTVNPQVHPD